MSLTLHLHPLSSYCQKVLIALYENGTPFTPHLVDLANAEANAAFKKLWPIGKFPVLRDEAADRTIPESTVIIDYLGQHYPGPVKLIPDDAEAALAVRALDRFYDLHVHTHMQKIIGDRLRPADKKDAYGVEQARAAMNVALAIVDKDMATRTWAAGEDFTLADCAAAPALFYIDMVVAPLAPAYPNLAAYLGRLTQRPSYARALEEAQPFMHWVPREAAATAETPSKTGIVRSCFDAYRNRQREVLENLFAEDFRFTSPYDDAIDKAAYFARCWPVSLDTIHSNTIEDIRESGEHAFVLYKCTTNDGKEFRNTERFTFKDGRLSAIDVYFGATYKDGGFVRQS